jgi:hypothetical protein
MGQIQWNGAHVGWMPGDNSYYLSVSAALDPPEIAEWLNAHLGRWLRRAFADRDEIRAEVGPPKQNGAPLTQILVTGLTEPLPDSHALRSSIEEAVVAAEHAVQEHVPRAEAYGQEFRR